MAINWHSFQLSTGDPMLALSHVFRRHLKDYATKILIANLPKSSTGSSLVGSTSSASLTSMTNTLTKDLKDFSTQGFIQNVQSFLKEGEAVRMTADERVFVCSAIVTAEYIIGKILIDTYRENFLKPCLTRQFFHKEILRFGDIFKLDHIFKYVLYKFCTRLLEAFVLAIFLSLTSPFLRSMKISSKFSSLQKIEIFLWKKYLPMDMV